MPVGVALRITSVGDYDLLTGLCEVRVFGRLYNGRTSLVFGIGFVPELFALSSILYMFCHCVAWSSCYTVWPIHWSHLHEEDYDLDNDQLL